MCCVILKYKTPAKPFSLFVTLNIALNPAWFSSSSHNYLMQHDNVILVGMIRNCSVCGISWPLCPSFLVIQMVRLCAYLPDVKFNLCILRRKTMQNVPVFVPCPWFQNTLHSSAYIGNNYIKNELSLVVLQIKMLLQGTFFPRGFKSMFPHIIAIWKPSSIVAM